MSKVTPNNSSTVIWTLQPWIIPGVLFRTLIFTLVTTVIIYLEFLFGANSNLFQGVTMLTWTIIAMALIWLISLLQLFIMKISNTYILRNDGIEIREGILSTKSYMIVSLGFSDLEVIRSLSGRVLNYGNIIIRIQSEKNSQRRMKLIKNPMKVAEDIRKVMTRPIVRIEEKNTETK